MLQTNTSNGGNVENTQLRFGSPRHGHFLTLRHCYFGFDPYFGSHWARSISRPLC